MLGKLILFAVVALLVYWAIKSHRRGVKQRHESQEPPTAAGEDMVRCAHCSVHLPKSESITTQGKFFCSDEHRRLHLNS